MNKKILVTGGSGMVGKFLQTIMPNATYLSSKDCDLIDQKSVKERLEFEQPDVVIHLAAKVGGIIDNINHPAQYFDDNILMNTNIIQQSYKVGVSQFIGILSTCIYPDVCDTYPIIEEKLHDGPPTPTNFSYAYAKRCLAVQIDAYNKEYGTKYSYLTPCNLYGECFSEDTEVLTVDGIKNIREIKTGDKVFTLNPETHDVEVHKVIDLQTKHSDEYYSFKSRSVDFNVTPEHKMYHKTTIGFTKNKAEFFKEKCGREYGQVTFAFHNPIINSDDNRKIDLSEYLDGFHIICENNIVKDFKHSKCKEVPTEYDCGDFSEFLGWYISEGSYCTTTKSLKNNLNKGQIRISQNKFKNVTKYKQIYNLLERMKIPFGCDEYSFYFSSRLFINYIQKNIGTGSGDKKIPKEWLRFDFPLRYREILFNAMMDGDGNSRKNVYTTKSRKLKNDFFLLCFLIGKKIGSMTFDGDCWKVYIKNKLKSSTVKYKNISHIKNENNKVFYCLTVEKNHIIYAGRNNKFNWIGQCDKYEDHNSHFVAALIKKIHKAKMCGEDKIKLFGTGKPLRQFMYGKDLAEVIKYCIDHEIAESFNVATPEIYSIKEIAEIALEACGASHLKIEFDSTKPDGQYRKDVSIDKLKTIIPDFKSTRLTHGIKTTYGIMNQKWQTEKE